MVAGAGSRRPLARAYYRRDAAVVARSLLGAILECDADDGRASGRIVETEAYLGPPDAASHAVAGLTPRTRDLFGPPGSAYVYFVYGVHWCVNAVTDPPGGGMAVLIRAIEPLDGVQLMRRRRAASAGRGRKVARDADVRDADRRDRELTNGPGKLCAALGIDGRMSGRTLQRPPITIRQGREVPDSDVLVSPRIGLTQAAHYLRRYFVRDNLFVSRTPAQFRVVPFGQARATR